MTRGAFGTVAVRVGRLADALDGTGLERLTGAAAFAVKSAGLRRLVLTIGGDRRMSRFGSARARGRVRAGIGYDLTRPAAAQLVYRPAGMWTLLETGADRHPIGTGRRTASGRRTRARGRPVLLVAGRPVTGPVDHPGTRPKRTLTRGIAEGERAIPAAVDAALADLVAELLED